MSQDNNTAMDDSALARSFSLFGVRVDVAKPHHAALAIFEGATAHVGIRVVLADLWTFLLAQRDYTVWESLSGADLVLPVGDDAVIRRLTSRRGVPTVESDKLVQELLIALEQEGKSLVLMAPEAELPGIGLLLHRLWPTLRVTEIGLPALEESARASERLVREVNAVQPEVLLIGGHSPWQERWIFEQREMLLAGAVVSLPSPQNTFAAIGQRAGIKSSGPQWQRRRVALRRAFDATIAPAAQASVRRLNELLSVPGETLKQTGIAQWRFNPVNLRQKGAPHASDPRGMRIAEWHDSGDSADMLPNVSPLARLGPPREVRPRFPALPEPSGEVDVAEQPTIALSLNALQAAVPLEVTGYIVDERDISATHQNGTNGAHDRSQSISQNMNQEDIKTGIIRDPDAPADVVDAAEGDERPTEHAAGQQESRGTTPLPQSDALATSDAGQPDAAPELPPTTLLHEPLAPTTKLHLPLAPTTKLTRRPEPPRPAAQAAETAERGEAPAAEATLGAASAAESAEVAGPADMEDAAATIELPATSVPYLEELATAASLGNTPRRILRRRRRLPPRRRKRYYKERG